jgi:hypothetical protein
MKLSIIPLLVTFALSSSAQIYCNEIKQKYIGCWVDTSNNHKTNIVISADSIKIKTDDYKQQVYKLKCKNNKVWFQYSKIESMQLELTQKKNLWLHYISTKEKYPISVPLISTIKLKKCN